MTVDLHRYYRYKLTKFNNNKKVIDRKFFVSLAEAGLYVGVNPATLHYQLKNTKHKSEKWLLMRFQKCNIDRQIVSRYTYVFDPNLEDTYDTDDENE